MQADAFNASRIDTGLVAVITSNLSPTDPSGRDDLARGGAAAENMLRTCHAW